MDIIRLLQVKNNRSRQIIEAILVVFGVIYLSLLITMHVISPRSSQPFWIFASYMAASLAAVHFIPRLNWLHVIALVALPVWPFSGNMFLFMDSMERRAADFPWLHSLLSFIQSVSIISIPVCIMAILGGLIGAGIVRYLDYKAGIER